MRRKPISSSVLYQLAEAFRRPLDVVTREPRRQNAPEQQQQQRLTSCALRLARARPAATFWGFFLRAYSDMRENVWAKSHEKSNACVVRSRARACMELLLITRVVSRSVRRAASRMDGRARAQVPDARRGHRNDRLGTCERVDAQERARSPSRSARCGGHVAERSRSRPRFSLPRTQSM